MREKLVLMLTTRTTEVNDPQEIWRLPRAKQVEASEAP